MTFNRQISYYCVLLDEVTLILNIPWLFSYCIQSALLNIIITEYIFGNPRWMVEDTNDAVVYKLEILTPDNYTFVLHVNGFNIC